jgi:hypothetical protein
MWESGYPMLARLITVRDPAIVFAFIFALLGNQGLIWAIARDNVDIEWWRASALAVLTAFMGSLAVPLGVSLGLGAILGSAFAVWLLCGWLYEGIELWQRAIMALGAAGLGWIAMLLGIQARIQILGW